LTNQDKSSTLRKAGLFYLVFVMFSYTTGGPFGLEDMAGNVWEWCLDYFELYRNGPKTNPRGATSGTKRVHRGGSWKSRFSSLRTTVRSSNVPGFSCNDLGFRIVCECD